MREPEPSVDATTRGSRPAWRVGISAEGTFSKGASPSLNPGLAAYLEFIDDAPGFLAPSFRIGAEIAADQQLESGLPMHYENRDLPQARWPRGRLPVARDAVATMVR